MPRKQYGNSLLETMVVISIIGVVLGLLYSYSNKGWKDYRKTFTFTDLQTKASAGLEEMVNQLKQSSKEYIYVGTGFNSKVPLPEDAYYNKAYLYFAVQNKQERDVSEIRTQERIKTYGLPSFDYYLYYVARIRDEFGEIDYSGQQAKIKLVRIPNQPGDYTINNNGKWPFLPQKMLETYELNKEIPHSIKGLGAFVKFIEVSPEFSLYQSDVAYYYYNSNFDNLFKIRIHLFDQATNTVVDFETAVSPRN